MTGQLPAQRLVCRRLRAIGLNPDQIPRHGGVDRFGYRTVNMPLQLNRRNDSFLLTEHSWSAPRDTINGILAAIKAFDRADARA